MFVAFLDASKAFDNISHNILFERLRNKNVPIYLINFLNYWYRNQRIYILNGEAIILIRLVLLMECVKVGYYHLYYIIFILIQ